MTRILAVKLSLAKICTMLEMLPKPTYDIVIDLPFSLRDSSQMTRS